MVDFLALYPGQGAQKPAMALDFYREFSAVRTLFALASDISGVDLHKLLSEGTEEALQKTLNTQLAVTLANVSATTVARELSLNLIAHAGFSLGELSAYWASGVLSAEGLFTLVKRRGEILSTSGTKQTDKLIMVALLGLGFEEVSHILRKNNATALFCTNDNSATQVVVSGAEAEFFRLERDFKAGGVKRIVRLKVGGAFHTPLMGEVQEEFAQSIAGLNFKDPQECLYSSVSGSPVTTGKEAKELCVRQFTSVVRWRGLMESLKNPLALELGPGRVLTPLFKGHCYPGGSYEELLAIKRGVVDEL